ncbi:hypothetical protein PVAP13_1NG373600 [Panicum virgatum]|uniref:Uncharacterized protein n=1 Tax=Panicum virgatum TaxID=38727 RepID=A0A8T0WZQ8_PANVG|nr:hypothetical protein PVAP13_1NG373600 [Panicum virgatum]
MYSTKLKQVITFWACRTFCSIAPHGNGNQAPGDEDASKMYVPFDKKKERKMYVPCKFSIFFLSLFFHYNRGSKSLLLEE